MIALSVQQPTTAKQADFHLDFIWVALATALFAGFAIGAHLTFVIGFDFPLGRGFYSFIQTHGHVQLVGWVGLFVMGVSLHFIPRLAGAPIVRPQWIKRVLGLMAAGLWLRSIGPSVAPYLAGHAAFIPVLAVTAFSGLLEWLGVAVYVFLLLQTFSKIDSVARRPALLAVAPFFGMMVAGWVIYASLNLIMLVDMAVTKNVVVQQGWNEFALQVFIGLILMPVAFAFSVRLFPLYLRLPAPDWPVRATAFAYLLALCLQLISLLPPVQTAQQQAALFLSSLGMLAKGGVILWFVWKLDLLTRRRRPWTVNRVFQPGPERTPTRPGLPDYGEFGRFERLVYSAYVWLLLGVVFEMLSGASVIWDLKLPHGSDVSRHMYLLGFITLLIFGMAVRMIPGFAGKKKVAKPKLVDATFWLGNAAALFRVLPLILPASLFEAAPILMAGAQTMFALSGILGLLAVLCLTINLWKTV